MERVDSTTHASAGGGEATGRRVLRFEAVEGVLLAAVALLTAWSGYQAALWNSRSALSYGQATAYRSSALAAQTLAGQQMLYDANTFSSWLVAAQANNTELMSFLERRFRPEYRPAFDAWLATDPLHNPSAPPGPAAMPQYRNANAEKAAALERQAGDAFDRGNSQRDKADDHVRVTVLLALALVLAALSRQFTIRQVRLSMLGLAILVLTLSIVALAAIGG
jgi:hypothetical protein